MTRPHLISVDELRAAGALDVPPEWRKSLGRPRQRDLFSDLVDDDDTTAAQSQSDPDELDSDESDSSDEE